MLKYKAEKKGGEVIEIDLKFTSQKCSCFSHISKENRKSQSKFKCIQCQLNHALILAKNPVFIPLSSLSNSVKRSQPTVKFWSQAFL